MNVPISTADRERIDNMVAAYKHQLEHLYELAHLAGQIAQSETDRAKLKAA